MLPNALYRFIRTGMVHPYAAYQTYKAYKYNDSPTLEVWLVYWIVMSAYLAVEMLTDIFMSWLPLYSTVKFGILIWLTAMRTQGSTIIFREIIHPHLTVNETKIDETLATMQLHTKTKLLHFCRSGLALLENLIGVAMTRSHGIIETYLLQRATSLPKVQHSALQRREQPTATVNQHYKRRLFPAVRGSATQSQIQKFEFLESRKYLSPDYRMLTPQLVSPPRTPSPNPYMHSQDYLEPQEVHYRGDGVGYDYLDDNGNRKKKIYQRIRKSSDASSDKPYFHSITHAPPRSQSAVPHY